MFCPGERGYKISPGFQPISAGLVRGASMGEWFLSLRDLGPKGQVGTACLSPL